MLLNGTSSSGNTTLAGELLIGFATPWFHLAVDDFGAMRSVPQTAALDEAQVAVVLRRARAGFHRSVAVMAAVGELERRERVRGDRTAGQAATQLPHVHAHGRYDLEFDTETTSPAGCARQVRAFLTRPAGATAFDQLRVDLAGGSTSLDRR